MLLNRLSVLNYRNLQQVELSFSPKLNCFFGRNGMGKTNLLDAIYYLSFCKSADTPIDSQNICHDAEFFVLQGYYQSAEGIEDEVYCGLKRQQKKRFRRNGKDYQRLADHIGLIPLVLVSPNDQGLILAGSEERRRFMDLVISQYDKEYLEALVRYNKSLAQRNVLLKMETQPDDSLFDVWEEQMAASGQIVFERREAFVREFIPAFRELHGFIAGGGETVDLVYQSQARDSNLTDLLRNSRQRDHIVGHSLCGIHRDDLNMLLGGYPIKREGSQGQNKTYVVALKLAQFGFLNSIGHTRPLLLLDDIFDRLDANRVEQIVKLVAGEQFGQIFITDTNRSHLDRILQKVGGDYRLFSVENGAVNNEEIIVP